MSDQLSKLEQFSFRSEALMDLHLAEQKMMQFEEAVDMVSEKLRS